MWFYQTGMAAAEATQGKYLEILLKYVLNPSARGGFSVFDPGAGTRHFYSMRSRHAATNNSDYDCHSSGTIVNDCAWPQLRIAVLASAQSILARTADGRVRAQARGVRFDRKPEQSPFQIDEALRRRAAGEALTEFCRSYDVSHSTISRRGRGVA